MGHWSGVIPLFWRIKKDLRSNLPYVREKAWKNGSDIVVRIIPSERSKKFEKFS
jgi:hypothetical protein